MSVPPPFALTEADRHSPLWAKLRGHFEARLGDLHAKLEVDQTENETAIRRGQIRCFRELIALGDAPPINRS